MKPSFSNLIFSNISPSSFVITEIPEFDDRINGVDFSTDLNICAAKCCFGPRPLPNHDH